MLHSGHVCLRLEHESLETRDGFYATLKYTASSTILIESSWTPLIYLMDWGVFMYIIGPSNKSLQLPN